MNNTTTPLGGYEIDMSEIVQQVCNNGLDGIDKVMSKLLNVAMQIEREQYLHAKSYERSSERLGYCNGYKDKSMKTRIGELDLNVPQVRGDGVGFYPSCLEKGIRSERALTMSLAQMYIQGVSRRKVERILKEMCGLEVTSVQVSRAAQQLDKEIELWRNRALGQTPHLILDARYEKVRVDGQVIDVAVLIGYGVDTNGCRRILGVSVELSEAEVHWRSFLESLVKRGLHGIKLIVSDDHSGLKAARKAVFPSIAWQRCQFHLQQNAQSYIAKKSDKKTIAAEIRAILNSEDLVEAERKLKILIAKYEDKNPRLSEWLEHAIPEGLSVFKMPTIQQKKLRTSNMAERVNQEVKRRTKVARIFPNIESLLRLVSAICMDIDEDWSTQTKRYLTKE